MLRNLLCIVYLNSPYPSNQKGMSKHNSDGSVFRHFDISKGTLGRKKRSRCGFSVTHQGEEAIV